MRHRTLVRVSSREALMQWAMVASEGAPGSWKLAADSGGDGSDPYESDIYLIVERFWRDPLHRPFRDLALRVMAYGDNPRGPDAIRWGECCYRFRAWWCAQPPVRMFGWWDEKREKNASA